MSKPAARIGDMHVCPMVTPGTPPVPHVGGPVMGPGVANVLICGVPAAVLGEMCTCVGPPDTIIMGSSGVLIGGRPAARMGDVTAHGGSIIIGAPTVLIGEVGAGGGGGSPGGMVQNAQAVIQSAPPVTQSVLGQVMALTQAAADGAPLVHNPTSCPDCPSHS